MRIKFFKLILLFVFLFPIKQFGQELNVFVSAHPDDWQLFMNPNAYHSLDSIQNKTLFIHTTAGDAGAGTETNYYLAREEGSLRAIRFMVNAQGHQKGFGHKMKIDSSVINGHPIINSSYANAKAYFLRLHDGYIVNDTMIEHPQSLGRLYNGKIKKISTIDMSTSYSSLDDLKKTLEDLIKLEGEGYQSINFHLAQNDLYINPYDHPDHIHSSLIVQDIAKELEDVTIYLYEEYATRDKPDNLFPEDFLINVGTWGATASGLSDLGHYPTWDNGHNIWLGKQYYIKVRD